VPRCEVPARADASVVDRLGARRSARPCSSHSALQLVPSRSALVSPARRTPVAIASPASGRGTSLLIARLPGRQDPELRLQNSLAELEHETALPCDRTCIRRYQGFPGRETSRRAVAGTRSASGPAGSGLGAATGQLAAAAGRSSPDSTFAISQSQLSAQRLNAARVSGTGNPCPTATRAVRVGSLSQVAPPVRPARPDGP
jgi:hypothetical protein